MRLFALLAMLSAANAHGWGDTGHRLIAREAAELAGGFWKANSLAFADLSIVPDLEWKKPKLKHLEAATHFFDVDLYVETPGRLTEVPRNFGEAKAKYGKKKMGKAGTAVWRLEQLHGEAVAAAKAGDHARMLQMAGTMAHYAGDLAQPLHNSRNYDGAETGQKGIHKFFEIDVVDETKQNKLRTDVRARARKLLEDPEFTAQFEKSVIESAFNESRRAFARLDDVLGTDRKHGRDEAGSKKQLTIVKERLGDATATLVLLLRKISAELPETKVLVSTPEFVPPQD